MSQHDHTSTALRLPVQAQDHGPACDHDHHTHAAADACCAPATQTDCLTGVCKSNPAPEGTSRVRYRIDKMDCPTEERLIRNKLEGMPGVVQLDFNLLNRELTVYHRLDQPRGISAALERLDMAPTLLDANAPVSVLPPALSPRQKGLLAVAGVAAVAAEIIAWSTGRETSWMVMALAAVSIVSAGLPTLKKGWIALKNLTLNIYFLMSIAVAGAVALGKWPEAAMVVFLFAVAEAIEALSLERARNAIKALTAIAPETAEVKAGEAWEAKPVAEVAVGSRIRVRAGARVPLDARVEFGRAALNQAPITGESLPVDKQAGDLLYAGSIVADGVVEATVTASAGDSTLARIALAIQSAQSQRAPTQRFVDQFARYYTPAVVVFAIAVAILGPLLTGGGWSSWLYEALVMLVIACPCALVVSTPVTVVSGLAAAAKHGILVKGGAFLEGGRLLKAVALDKTGTLTLGKPALADAIPLGDMPIAQALRIAASLDDHSTHPVAQALVAGWREQQPGAAVLPVDDFGVLQGRGVTGSIAGQVWHLGNHRLVEEIGGCSAALEARLAVLENAGKTAIVLCDAAGPVAVFGVADTLRPESAQAVASLKSLHVEPVMLTGDNPATARAIAGQLGIADARGNLLPQDKQAAVAELLGRYGSVGMVGDGVNDAPALARATIGFAMGAAGTATALETADVAIMDDDPRKIADFISLSRRTAMILKQNIALALGIKAVFFVLALSGVATLWMAVFADTGTSLLVVFNGMRLLRR
ncbi:MAG: heavy metal translocating P-type ATPase [Thiomonas arsenitoxydans]|uniref:P-type Zn(2+) transporter n=1 Tax=Thiomonas arsenitoxydans (strain DSM 22701 / CIP 110005 / 3As) TaxID=426114 RepID=A0A8I1MV57_THIA3|nr:MULTISPECIES: heavy metal translocating P-type ATPase [Thiomonas]MBN8744341.1 heavy metal translocating P-type ATPase [Thiomonas arsenitoxydans]ODU96687.1 MAG: 4-deoxy-4-formamido-L-arabinose-phospho-UDP deformylase [Thiomonas sp. SCN 64-16]